MEQPNPNRADHLAEYRFKPGQTGNAGGRPKKNPVSDVLKNQLDMPVPAQMLAGLKEPVRAIFAELYGENPTFADFVAFKLIQQSLKGDIFALKEMLERVEGKVVAKVEHAGSLGVQLLTSIPRPAND